METKRKQIIEQFKGQTRLPKFAIPTSYDLYLKLDLTACTFSGTVQVNLNIIEHTKFLVLNVLELDVHQVWFTNSNHQVINTLLNYRFYCALTFNGFFFFLNDVFVDFCRHISLVMLLFWMVKMRYWCWGLMKCLVLVMGFWGLSFLGPLTHT